MKRDHIFRAWDEELNKMFDGDEIEESETIKTYLAYGKLVVGCFPKDADYYELIPLEYIGLKDKNGVQIYEGDIIKWRINVADEWENSVCKVVFNAPSFDLLRYWHSENKWLPLSISADLLQLEIIGNIYQNEELLTTT